MVVCGHHGDHFEHPSFDYLSDQALVGDCKTEAWSHVVVTSIDVVLGVGFCREALVSGQT